VAPRPAWQEEVEAEKNRRLQVLASAFSAVRRLKGPLKERGCGRQVLEGLALTVTSEYNAENCVETFLGALDNFLTGRDRMGWILKGD
jgi:hypothetical protein